MRLHRLFACVATVGALLAAFLPQPALSTDVSFAFTLTANGQRLPNLPLIGDGSTVSACTIVVTSGSLFTLVPQWGPDGSAWHTATTVGGGSITATGSYGPGNIPLNDGGGHNTAFFGGVLSSFTAGTVKGTETCTNAVFPTPPPSPTPTPNPFTYPTTTPGGVLKANLTDAAGVSFTGASPVPVVGSIVAAIGVPTVIPSCPAASYPCGLPTPNANVQPSPIYTSPISGTVTNNCATNCTPNPATPQFVHPDGTPFPISGSVTALISPSPFATFSPFPAGAVVLTGPSTAPAPSAGAYVVCVDSSGKLCVQTPAPVTQVSASIGPVTIAAPTDAGGNVKVVAPAPSATQPVSCAAAANCPVNATQVTSPWVVTTAPPGPTPVPWTTASPAPIEVVSCRTCANFKINSASTTGCNSISTTAKALLDLMNGATAQTVAVSFYDEGSTPSCAAADLIYSPVFGPSQIMLFASPYGHILTNGLAYSATTASLVGNVWGDLR